MPTPTTADQFLELVSKSGLLDAQRLEELARRRAGGKSATPRELADALIRDGVLTRFQAEQLLCGRYRHFVLSCKYKVLRPLGAGGMGLVFLCEHTVMRRRVAVKLLPPGRAGDSAAVERFHREARAVARLHHPNIVAAHDADRDGRRHFLVMEYIDGPTLRHLVRQHGPLPVGRAADYVRQAALALQHAHDHGLIHRDVKPSNLLVDRAGQIKVLDLGLARFFQDEADDLSQRHRESPLGTTDYVAPEQALDSHGADARSDVYSLGATLYYLLAGHGPFQGGTPLEKLVWHQVRQPRPLREVRPEVPAELAAVVEKMMAKSPADRYQTADEAAEALAPLAQPGPPPLWSETEETVLPSGGLTALDVSPPSRAAPAPLAEAVAAPLRAEGGGAAAAPPPSAQGHRWGWALALGLAGVLVAAGAVGLTLYKGWRDTPEGDGPQPQPGPAEAAPRLRLLVPAYFYPAGKGLAEWERLLKAPAPASVVIIVNPASGPGRETDFNFGRVIARAREKGFTLVGYVSTGYAHRPVEEVKEDIDRWVRFYPAVEGIFFDEQASGADRVDYYAELYRYAHQRGLRLVVNNPGTTCAPGYLTRPAADVVCMAESNRPLSEFRAPAWATRYPAGHFAALLHTVTDAARMKQFVQAMADKRIGYCYITDRGMPNPWDRLPGYWEAEVEAVRRVNEAPAPSP